MTDSGGPVAGGAPSQDAAEASLLYDLAPCGLLVIAEDGTILRANATMLARTGYTLGELIGRGFSELLDPGAQIFYETRFLPVLHLQGEVREVALALRLADGATLPVLVNATARVGAGSAIVDVAVFDSRERQDYERQLMVARRNAEASERRLRILQDATSVFGEKETEEALAQALADSARGALEATSAAVFLDDHEPRLTGGTVPVDPYLVPGGSLPGVPAPDSVAVESVGQDDIDPALAAALRGARLEALVRVLLTRDDTAVGELVCYFARTPELDEHARDLVRALCRQAAQTLARIRLQAKLAAIALYDPLTGLANRVLLRDHLSVSVAVAAEREQPLALIFVDLDDFKAINDELDHTAGDTVLKLTAARLAGAVRGGDLVCRYGGDEFIIVCQNTDEHAAEQIAERIRMAVGLPLGDDGWQRTVTASVGVTVHTASATHILTGPELLRVADEAMYRSKVRGKDRVTVIAL